MSLKQMIEYWKAGVELGEKEQYQEAIRKFLDMPEPGARIHFNIANMYLRLGKLVEAEEVFLKQYKQSFLYSHVMFFFNAFVYNYI